MPLLYTSIYASILALVVIALALLVVFQRRTNGVGVGYGEHKALRLAIRAHANAIENLPIVLILMAIYELQHGSVVIINVIGITLIVARLIHALGLSRHPGYSFGRFWGALLTWLAVIFLAGANLYKAIAFFALA